MSGRLPGMAVLLGVIVLLIAYGSLFPFDFAWDNVPRQWEQLLHDRRWLESRADALGNVGLFVPLGVVGMWAFGAYPAWARATIVIFIALFLAISLQVLQLFSFSRVAVMSDVLWNMMGTFVGIIAGGLIRVPHKAEGRASISVPMLLLGAFIAAEWVPFIPSLDVQTFRDGLKPLLLEHRFAWPDTVFHAAGAALAGRLLSAQWGRRVSLVVLPVLLGVIFVGKAFIVMQYPDLSALVGFAAGFLLWALISFARRETGDILLLWTLVAGYTIAALWPATGGGGEVPFNWVPFAAVLQGSMLSNVESLAYRLVFYLGVLWLVRQLRAKVLLAGVLLALWVFMLEWLQASVAGRHGDVTEPLWVLLVAFFVYFFLPPSPSVASRSRHPRESQSGVEPVHAVGKSRSSIAAEHTGSAMSGASSKEWMGWVGAAGLFALGLYGVLRLPELPYNVRELFLGDGNLFFLFIFSLSLLWVGSSSGWIGQRMLANVRSVISFPFLIFVASVIHLLLLSASVTQESIMDIAGSSNLFWFVTNKDTWGAWGKTLFLALDAPGLIGTLERAVRYWALYGPPAMTVALLYAWLQASRASGRAVGRVALATAWALPWFWLAKGIAFDWSSTDNLNELIARDGPAGWGGGGYLYLLMVLCCATAVLVGRVRLRPASLLATIAMVVASVPLGWILLNQGLEPRVEKYGYVFSGVQFLLAPDRAHTLDSEILFARWAVVQLGLIAIIAAGIRLSISRPWQPEGRRGRSVARRSAQDTRPAMRAAADGGRL